MSSYTIDHKFGSRYAPTKTAGELKYCNSFGRFNKTIIPLAFVRYEIVIAISHPSRAHGIIVKFARSVMLLLNVQETLLLILVINYKRIMLKNVQDRQDRKETVVCLILFSSRLDSLILHARGFKLYTV